MIKKFVALLLALVCILSMSITAFAEQGDEVTANSVASTNSMLRGAYDPYIPGGTPIIEYVDLWPISLVNGQFIANSKYVAHFEWDQSNPKFGSVIGSYTPPSSLNNVVAVRAFIGWRYPEHYVYISDPTNGFHRSAYELEDIRDIHFTDCKGNMHIEVLNSNYSTYIDIKVPYMS